MNRLHTFRLTLALPLTAAVAAQIPDNHSVPPSFAIGRVPIHTADDDSGRAYGTWAATETYKVSFHGDATFVPYLGDAYPVNQPLAWHTESVAVGSAELLPPGRPAARSQAAYRYEMRFGDVTEAYDVLETGLEQTFVIHRRPAVAGDLVVRGRVRTPLRADVVGEHHGAIAFRDERGREVVRYGAAVAFDARGDRTEVLTSFDGECVHLRVPATWLSTAAFPVVVDPLLTRATFGGGNLVGSMDIARDETGDDLMLVYTKDASASDQDLFARMCADDWSGMTTVFTDVTTSWSTENGNVATAGSPQKYCVVFERHLAPRKVRTHLHDSGNFSLDLSVIGLEPPSGSHDWRPDVGGQMLSTATLLPTGTKFLIAFQREATGSSTFANTATSSIYGRTLDADGTLSGEFPIQFSLLGSVDHEWPNVNQQGKRVNPSSPRSDWMVAYQRYTASGSTWRAHAKLVRDDGSISSSTWVSSGDSATSHRLTPKVAGHSGRYLVSVVESSFASVPIKTQSTLGHSWRAERVDWPAGGNPTNYPDRNYDGPRPQANLELGDVSYDSNTRSHWAITVRTVRSAGGSARSSVWRVGYQGLITESQTLLVPQTSTEQGLIGGVCFDADSDAFVASFGVNTGTIGTVYANKLVYTAATPVATSGVGCASGVIGWSGPQQIGSQFTNVLLTGAPATVPAVLALATAPADLDLTFLQMPGCRLLVDALGAGFITTLSTATNATGSVSIPLSFPEPLPATTLYFQWFHVELAANPVNLVSTQRMAVNMVK
ncbi:MAG: hypothetical protein R3F56_21990 [Planctomycetota bacterium]